MTRQEAGQFARNELNKHGLQKWGVRLNNSGGTGYLGFCDHTNQVIILNSHHVDIHTEPDIKNTIRHEIAHALVGAKHGHDEIWAAKASEIGCDNTSACSNLSLPPALIDAIRAGATVEVTFEEEVIRRPKYTVTRLQEKCEYCGKVAKSKSESTVENSDPTRPDLKIIHLECGHTLIKKIPKGTPFHLFQKGGDPTCPHVWAKNTCLKCGRNRPYDFQIAGMLFLEMGLSVNKGAGCFDQMGLGKTIQAEGVIYYHPEWQPTLWIVKSGLKYQLAVSIIQWMGNEHCPQIIERSGDFLIPGLKHYIVGYDMLVPKTRTLKSGKTVQQGFDITKFDKIGIKCVILDECQQIKNPDSSRTQQVRKIVKDKKVLPLSGTPWKNRGSELYPVFNMMDPVRFWSADAFKRQWVHQYWVGNRLVEGGINNPEKFREYTKDMCIRRERTEVLPELPLINRTKLYVQMSPAEEKVYDAAVEDFVKWYEEQATELSGMVIIAAMQKMRHLVALAKIPATLEYVDEFIEDTDRKLVVFVHHIDCQDMLFDEIKKLAVDEEGKPLFPVLQLKGGASSEKKFEIQTQFNDAPRAILVASQLSSQEGLNLQTCSDCVMHERQWNPGNEEQAEGRFIRIGSEAESVNAVYTQLEGLTTIDPQMDGIVERKRIQFHEGMNKTEMETWNENALMRELAADIVANHKRKNRKAS